VIEHCSRFAKKGEKQKKTKKLRSLYVVVQPEVFFNALNAPNLFSVPRPSGLLLLTRWWQKTTFSARLFDHVWFSSVQRI